MYSVQQLFEKIRIKVTPYPYRVSSSILFSSILFYFVVSRRVLRVLWIVCFVFQFLILEFGVSSKIQYNTIQKAIVQAMRCVQIHILHLHQHQILVLNSEFKNGGQVQAETKTERKRRKKKKQKIAIVFDIQHVTRNSNIKFQGVFSHSLLLFYFLFSIIWIYWRKTWHHKNFQFEFEFQSSSPFYSILYRRLDLTGKVKRGQTWNAHTQRSVHTKQSKIQIQTMASNI